MIRLGRFLSQTQTSSIFRWKNGYAGCGTYLRSSVLKRYVASCVSTQYRKSPKTAEYSFLRRSSASASNSSSSSRWLIARRRGSSRPSVALARRAPAELGERLQHESALVEPRMWDTEPRLVDLLGAVEQEVEVERPRPARRALAAAAVLGLDPQQELEQRPGRQRGFHRDRSVEEPRLLLDGSDRVRLAEARHRHDLDSRLSGEPLDRFPEHGLPVADIRSESDIRANHLGILHLDERGLRI